MEHGFLYLVAVIDWASRWHGDCRIRWTRGFAPTRSTKRWRDMAAPRIFNTDQGSQFTSEAFTGRLIAAGVAISMDGRGRFLDNIFIERLWRSIKYEEMHLKAYANGREARAGIGSWIILQRGAPSPGDGQSDADGRVARRHEKDRSAGKNCGYGASLGQRKRVDHIPTAAEATVRGSLIFDRQEQTVTP